MGRRCISPITTPIKVGEAELYFLTCFAKLVMVTCLTFGLFYWDPRTIKPVIKRVNCRVSYAYYKSTFGMPISISSDSPISLHVMKNPVVEDAHPSVLTALMRIQRSRHETGKIEGRCPQEARQQVRICSPFWKSFKEKNPNNKSVSVVGKAGGDKWKSLSEAEKAPYVAKAAKFKTEYTKKIAAYNKNQSGGGSHAAADEDESDKSKSEVNDDDEEEEGSEEEEEDDE
ncbi:hypothetical protein GW17_00036826 [Ensete ventricosum]|nr:hypothetical protein GW17_00036826 [Ensete ventricosum]RZS27628.1 hypothetical protein BHM03_00061136 [Ensete ventricosum]